MEFKNSRVIFTYVAACIIGLAIPTIYYGFRDENSDCQDDIEISLNAWTKTVGFEKIVYILLVCILMYLIDPFNLTFGNGRDYRISLLVLGILDFAFSAVWTFVGIVSLSSTSCLTEKKGVAIMSLINIILCLFLSAMSSYTVTPLILLDIH
jgi:hypothetical protein